MTVKVGGRILYWSLASTELHGVGNTLSALRYLGDANAPYFLGRLGQFLRIFRGITLLRRGLRRSLRSSVHEEGRLCKLPYHDVE
jgi:hypothetical protein